MSRVLLYLNDLKVVSYHPDPDSLTEAELSAGTLYDGDFPGFDADHDLEYHDGVVIQVDKPPIDPEDETLKEKLARIEEENDQLKTRLNSTEIATIENTTTTQALLELLIDMEVI